MLTQLSTVRSRLAIDPADTTPDALLTRFIEAITTIFDHHCNRTLARTVGATEEFPADSTVILPACYPIETVGNFELKTTEIAGWILQNPPNYIIRQHCVIYLDVPFGNSRQQARVTYTGGYVMPGSVPGAGQTPLPADIEHAAVEQVAAWYLHRNKIGLIKDMPSGGIYQQYTALPLLSLTQLTIAKHERWIL